MNFAVKGLLAGFWLFLIPTASGIPFLRKKANYTLSECFFTGYLFLFAIAELLIMPLLCLDAPLHILVLIFALLAGAVSIYGAVCFFRNIQTHTQQLLCTVRNSSVFFWYAVLLILMQAAIVALYAHFDADDAFYVATAVTSVETDTIFSVNAYTGLDYLTIQSRSRYILSPFPVFLAMISQLCGGLHPSIVAHTIFPPVFLILTYTVLYQFGRKWFPDDSRRRGIFIFLTAVLSCFTSFSAYYAGNFQMIRIWQGKALLAAAMIPLLIYLSLCIIMEEKPEYPWYFLLLLNLGCCLLTSMGIMLAPLIQGIFILLCLLQFRSLKRMCKGLLCCIPSLILGAVYIML